MFSTSFPRSSPTRPISRPGDRVGKDPEKEVGVNTLCDRLATDRSVCTGRTTTYSAATNRFVCAGDLLWKSLSMRQNFVAATSRKKKKKNGATFAATKFCCSDKDFHKRSQVHTKRFVAAKCRHHMLQLLSPSVYRPLRFYRTIS